MFKPLTYLMLIIAYHSFKHSEPIKKSKKNKKKSKIMFLGEVFNIPGVAGAALQTPL